MFAFDFVVDGPPISQQARRREGLHAWRDLVRAEAEKSWPPYMAPLDGALRFSINYYFEGMPVDSSDIVKPIQDALIGLIYTDYAQIAQVSTMHQDLGGSFTIASLTPALAEGFSRGGEFLYILVEALQDEEPTS